jgi:tetratricopeptide (TPR) repeat protein
LAISACGGWGTAQDHYNEGIRLKEQGRLLEAITAYDRALRVDPHYAAAFNNRGATYVNMGRHQEALKDLNNALRLKPELAEAYVNRALAYAFLGDDAAAQQDLQKGAELGFDTAVPSAFIERLKAQR